MKLAYILDNIENIIQIFRRENSVKTEPYQVGNSRKRSEKRKSENKNHPIGWLTNWRFDVYWRCRKPNTTTNLNYLGGGVFV